MRQSASYGLGVFQTDKHVYLYYNAYGKNGSPLTVDSSNDGFAFSTMDGEPYLFDIKNRHQNTLLSSDYHISHNDSEYYLVYKLISETRPDIRLAVSDDLMHWKKVGGVTNVKEPGLMVPDYKYNGRYVIFYGEGAIRVAYSTDLQEWTTLDKPIITPRMDAFDRAPLTPATAIVTKEGIMLYYYVHGTEYGADCWAIGSVLLDIQNPEKVLARSQAAILEHVEGLEKKSIKPVGVVMRGETLISYWDVENEGIVAIAHNAKTGTVGKDKTLKLVLEKLKHNPILKPIAEHFWESKAVFNPAAIYENGKVHLVYRAVGDNDVSVLGYASSNDGVTIDERLPEPIYVPRKPFEMNLGDSGKAYTSPFFSGGAYGGVEDPRITKVDDTYFMMYVAYDGCHPPRVALSSIPVSDFHNHNWSAWKEPAIVSKPGVVDKNACVLSEKINGKYCVFHRIFPNILVDYVDDLNELNGEDKYLKGEYAIPPRAKMWDSRKLGIGAPPIKTDKGWLLVYQAVDDRDASKYKIGAMLLDRDQPHKVTHRSRFPILQPDQWYENEGMKYGVAYPCGAVIMNDNLNVYYGGADTVVCMAQAPVDEFLDKLTHNEHATVTPVMVRGR